MRTAFLVSLVLVLAALPLVAEDRAVCAVCGPREGSGFEPAKATATVNGQPVADLRNVVLKDGAQIVLNLRS
jgi:hypothetical protein